MTTAPLDKEPPFVLLPMRESAWQKLVRRAIRFFNWCGHQKRGVNRISQGQSALNISSQVSGNDLLGRNYAANQGGVWSAQSNSYQAIDMAQSGSLLKVNEGGVNAVNNCQSGILGQGLGAGALAHDGSFKFFKWDNAKGCMVPFEPSTPLIQRFARSADAFLRSWRLG